MTGFIIQSPGFHISPPFISLLKAMTELLYHFSGCTELDQHGMLILNEGEYCFIDDYLGRQSAALRRQRN